MAANDANNVNRITNPHNYRLPESLVGDKIFTFKTTSITQDFFFLKKLGEGSYGYVIKARSKEDEKIYALKFLEIEFPKPTPEHGTDPDKRETISIISSTMLAEACIPRTLNHPNIIKYGKIKVYEITAEDQKMIQSKFDLDRTSSHVLCIAMPVMDGSLFDFKIRNKEYRKQLIFQTIEILDYLKSQNIMHCDIKPDNIFYRRIKNKNVPFKAILGDFGIARSNICYLHHRVDPNIIYTVTYRPPEIVKLEYDPDKPISEHAATQGLPHGFYPDGHVTDLKRAYDFPAEVWAMGCTIYYMATGETLFRPMVDTSQIKSNFSFDDLILKSVGDQQNEFTGVPVDKVGEELKELLDLMLVKDPSKRATPQELLRHPYFDSVRPTMQKWYRGQAEKIELYKSPESCLDKVLASTGRFVPTKGTPNDTNMRQVLTEWALEVGEEFQLNSSTIALYLNYIDRFLIENNGQLSDMRSQLQCIMCAFMYISAMLNEIWSVPIEDYAYISANAYTVPQIFGCILNLLHVLDWNVNIMTIYDLIAAQPLSRLRTKDYDRDILDILKDFDKSKELYEAFHSLPEAVKYAEDFFK